MRRIGAGLVLCAILGATVAGCGRSPQTTFYTLSPIVEPAREMRAVSTVAVVSVTVPEMVDRPQLVVPDGGARVAILESRRWAEPLKSAIPRVLAQNLARLLQSDRVSFAPQHAADRADRRLFVDMQRFELSGEEVVVEALWTVRSSGGGGGLTRRFEYRERLADRGYDLLVAAYERGVAALARQIADTIGEGVPVLPSDKKTPGQG